MSPRRPFGLPIALSSLVACGGATLRAADPSAPAALTPAGDEADTSRLSGETRTRLDADKVEVVDSDSDPSSYAFRDGHGDIPKEDFVRRYHDVTGQTDLDRATSGDPGSPVVVAGVVAVAAGAIGCLALLATSSQSQRTCTDTANGQVCFDQQGSSSQAGVVAGEVGLLALGAVGAALIISGLHSNRAAHELSRSDAERFARRYNRALLRSALGPGEPAPTPDRGPATTGDASWDR